MLDRKSVKLFVYSKLKLSTKGLDTLEVFVKLGPVSCYSWRNSVRSIRNILLCPGISGVIAWGHFIISYKRNLLSAFYTQILDIPGDVNKEK